MTTTRRFYSNNAPEVQISSSITSSGTTVTAPSFAGWQTNFPYFATLDIGTASAEIVSVTGISGSNATVVRGQGNTSAIGHPAGATFDMTAVALDYDEANLHTSSSAGVHGVSGNVVGSNDVQTLTNKTLSNPTFNGTATGVNEHLTGTLTVDGATTLASNSVTGNETVGGVLSANKGVNFAQYANEAAATAAGANVAGNVVWLTAPTGVGYAAGLFEYTGSAWAPVVDPALVLPHVLGTGPAASGSYVAPAKFQFGTASGTNAAGGFTVNYPTPFPNGVFAVVVTLNGGGRADVVSQTASGFVVKNYNAAGTQLTTGTSFVFYIVIGS